MSEKTKLINSVRNVDEAIDYLGFGRFTISLIFSAGMFYMGEAAELNLLSILTPELRCTWNLSYFQSSLLSSATYSGLFLGNIYWGYLSDIYGRKIVLVAGSFLSVFFGLLTAATQGFVMFVLMRFMVGLGLGAAIHIMVYIGEFVPKAHRGKSIAGSELFYAFGSIYIVVTAMLLMQSVGWKYYILVTIIPPVVFFFMSFWLPESIHFLQNTNKYDELAKTLHWISVVNNTNMPDLDLDCCGATTQQQRGDIKILLRDEYRWNFIAMVFPSLAGMGSYFGLILLNTEILSTTGFCHEKSFNSTKNKVVACHRLDASDYKQSLFVVLAELPGILLPTLTIDIIGRKAYLMGSLMLTGIGFICLNFCLSGQAGMILMFLMRILATGTSQVVIVVGVEIFPTLIRTTAFGLLIGICRFFLIFVPFFVVSLYSFSKIASTGLFAGLCFVGVVSLFFIKETNNTSLRNS